MTPRNPAVHTVIEFTHRVAIGPTLGLLVVGFVALAFRLSPRYHVVSRLAVLVCVFTVTDALIGAALVLLPCGNELLTESRVLPCDSPAQYDGPAGGDRG